MKSHSVGKEAEMYSILYQHVLEAALKKVYLHEIFKPLNIGYTHSLEPLQRRRLLYSAYFWEKTRV